MEAEGPGGSRGKLLTGCRVIFLHPEWDLPCEACEAWLITASAELKRDPATGEPLVRGDTPTPCEACPKVPTWAKKTDRDVPALRALAADLSPENRKAVAFWRSARAAGLVVADPVYVWYAGVIQRAVDETVAARADRLYEANRSLVRTVIELTMRRR